MTKVLKISSLTEAMAYAVAMAHDEAIKRGAMSQELSDQLERRADEFFKALATGKMLDFHDPAEGVKIVDPAELGFDQNGDPATKPAKKLVIGDKL